MIYSCFDQNSGLYDYFEDSSQRPINADLPVPRFPSMVGKIGVPAREAGRPLPSGARPAGRGWHARGMIVQCRGGLGLSGLPAPVSSFISSGGLVAAGAGVGAVLGLKKGGLGQALGWGLGGAVVGGLAWYAMMVGATCLEGQCKGT